MVATAKGKQPETAESAAWSWLHDNDNDEAGVARGHLKRHLENRWEVLGHGQLGPRHTRPVRRKAGHRISKDVGVRWQTFLLNSHIAKQNGRKEWAKTSCVVFT